MKTGMTALLAIAACLCAFPALADAPSETSRTTSSRLEPRFQTPIGLGVMGTRSGTRDSGQTGLGGTTDFSVVVEGQNHFKQRRGLGGFRQYGHAQARAELGTAGAGLRLSATPGFTIIGLPPAGGAFAPHIGIEPVAGRISLGSEASPVRSYEWMPAFTVGTQWGLGGACRLLPLGRLGAGIGNLGREAPAAWNWSPSVKLALGAGTYLNCPDWDLAVELTHLDGAAKKVNLFVSDFSYAIRPSRPLKVGLRAESEIGRGGASSSSPDYAEQRLLVMLRSELGS